MHCKRCDYPLWDMATRVCPECGLGFSPVDYEFVVNSVRFMCPHCRQAYYGTGEKGHLVPRRFTCVKCASAVDESEMLVLPTAGVSEVQTVGGVVAWRERAERGRLVSFFKAIGQAAFFPHRLARFCGQSARPLDACWFGLIVVVATVVLCVGWLGVLVTFFQGSRLGMQGNLMDMVSLVWQGAMWIALPTLAIAALTAAWIGSAQLILALKNPRPVSAAKTAESFGYAWGACFLMAVPCLGFYMIPFALIWVSVSAIVQLCVRHEVGAGRAVWAVLTLPLLLVVAMAGWIGLMIAMSS